MAKIDKTYYTRVRKFQNGITPEALEDEFDNLAKTLNKIVSEMIIPVSKQANATATVVNNSVKLNTIQYNEKLYSGYEADYIIKDVDVNTPVAEDLFLARVKEGDLLAFIHFPRKTGFVATSSDLEFRAFDSDGNFFTGKDIGIESANPHDESIWKIYSQDDIIYYRFEAEATPFDTGEGKIIAVILRKPDVKSLTIQPINIGVVL